MKTKTYKSNPWLSQWRIALCLAIFLFVLITGCVPASMQALAQPTPGAIEPSPMPTMPSATATSEDLIPGGWTTHTSQRCEYALSYPADMQASYDTPYSHTFAFKLANPEEGARNFVYVSVIDQEFRSLNVEDVYNYVPEEADRLLNLQVGESKAVNDVSQVAPWNTYQRLPDTTISGSPAQAYENAKPWEFPEGTKEIRYYVSQEGCTYQIGAYVDTTQSNQPGVIMEDLFQQIVDTFRVMP